MICEACGERYPEVWWAKDDLWEQVSEGYDLLCPRCFDIFAEMKGIYLHWGCKAEEYPLDTEILALETRAIEVGELIERLRTCNEHLSEKLDA